jgi:hypothetical protein
MRTYYCLVPSHSCARLYTVQHLVVALSSLFHA